MCGLLANQELANQELANKEHDGAKSKSRWHDKVEDWSGIEM
jgi:hypothetical protein